MEPSWVNKENDQIDQRKEHLKYLIRIGKYLRHGRQSTINIVVGDIVVQDTEAEACPLITMNEP